MRPNKPKFRTTVSPLAGFNFNTWWKQHGANLCCVLWIRSVAGYYPLWPGQVAGGAVLLLSKALPPDSGWCSWALFKSPWTGEKGKEKKQTAGRFLKLRRLGKILNSLPPYLSLKMTAILQHYQKVVSREDRPMCVRQLVAVGSRWCRELEPVVRNHMINPCIIFTVPEEAALYGGVQQVSDGSHWLGGDTEAKWLRDSTIYVFPKAVYHVDAFLD